MKLQAIVSLILPLLTSGVFEEKVVPDALSNTASSEVSGSSSSISHPTTYHRIMWMYETKVTTATATATATTSPYATWMTDNFDVFRNRTLTSITIPGSHDAGMYVSRGCTPGATECNTQTQQYTILEQLERGVRYFDLRPIYTGDEDGAFSTGHFSGLPPPIDTIVGCLGGKLDDILDDIESFASLHPQELIILQFSHYLDRTTEEFSFTPEILNQLTNLVSRRISADHLIVTNSTEQFSLLGSTYEEIINRGNVIALFRDFESDSSRGLFQSNDFPVYDRYSGTNDVDVMMADQIQKLKDEGNRNERLFLLSWTLTQTAAQAVGCLRKNRRGDNQRFELNSSIRDLAQIANKRFDNFLTEQERTNTVSNIIYTDFVDGSSTRAAMLSNGITEDPGQIPCQNNDQCANGECARRNASENDKVCCRGNDSGLHFFQRYCYNMPNGNECFTNKMCESRYCEGNMESLRRGICSTPENGNGN